MSDTLAFAALDTTTPFSFCECARLRRPGIQICLRESHRMAPKTSTYVCVYMYGCMYVCIYIYIYIYIYISHVICNMLYWDIIYYSITTGEYIYIYIHIHIYIYIYIHTHAYIYIYIYIYNMHESSSISANDCARQPPSRCSRSLLARWDVNTFG